MQVLTKLESLANSHKNGGAQTTPASMDPVSHPHAQRVWLFDFKELRNAVAAVGGQRSAVQQVTPPPSGWYNGLVKLSRKLLGRLLAWYIQPQREFNQSALRNAWLSSRISLKTFRQT